MTMQRIVSIVVLVLLAACRSVPQAADPASDAPEASQHRPAAFKDAASYQQAVQTWRSAEDVNAWIGARFSYDMARAMQLSETQRGRSGPLPIRSPQEFFAAPSGMCVDLARFAVETLRQMAPETNPTYLMIEFAPVSLAGNTLRLHWIASFVRDGRHYFFADSKRPGVVAGPYDTTQQFIDAYAAYRGRAIVRFRLVESYQRQQRTLAQKQGREDRVRP
jgi:hypothetical protein